MEDFEEKYKQKPSENKYSKWIDDHPLLFFLLLISFPLLGGVTIVFGIAIGLFYLLSGGSISGFRNH